MVAIHLVQSSSTPDIPGCHCSTAAERTSCLFVEENTAEVDLPDIMRNWHGNGM